ncbi:hypothetical protein T484DRAFT_1777129 [Baffinella frigidus]|nr:hypothetical protein T484DRAFT_1777129 [Cryptophyta sp. CCMP2293]
MPHQLWFCREVGIGQRHLLEVSEGVYGVQRGEGEAATYDLKKRDYLCSTSMTAENAFLVANFAHTKRGQLVLDPFCGSASLLISAAHWGAQTMGGDIDIRVIRGKPSSMKALLEEKDKEMPSHCRFARSLATVEIGPGSNFLQYGLTPPLDFVRCDNANPVWKIAAMFDAIICDPPYGVRAGARKTGTCKEVTKPIPEELKRDHIPGTVPYGIADVMMSPSVP